MKTSISTRSVLGGLLSGLLLLAATAAVADAQTIRFQEGAEIIVNGAGTGVIYTHTKDTYTDGAINNGNHTGVWLFPPSTGLLRFEEIFGAGVGQIPTGAVIESATLSFTYIGWGTGTISFGRLNPSQTWTEDSNYHTFSGGNGLQYGTDAVALGTITLSAPNDVTSSLIAWSGDPASNNGWGFTASSITGFMSSDNGNVASRPVLTVTFLPPNSPPTANAGPDQSIRAGAEVILDGTASFDDNTLPENLDYQWSFVSKPEGSSADFDDATSPFPSFVADEAGTYLVSLIVTDGGGLSSGTDTVDISSLNLAPTAVATVDFSLAIIGESASLDGSASMDPDGDELWYQWVIIDSPLGSMAGLSGADTATAIMTPDVEGVYVVILEVSDFLGPGTPAVLEITATTVTGYAEVQIIDAFDTVVNLTSAEVTTQGNQQALKSYLTSATEKLQDGKVSQAIARLNQAIERVDGWALRGAADGNGKGMDWVTDREQQLAIYAMLTDAVDALQP